MVIETLQYLFEIIYFAREFWGIYIQLLSNNFYAMEKDQFLKALSLISHSHKLLVISQVPTVKIDKMIMSLETDDFKTVLSVADSLSLLK